MIGNVSGMASVLLIEDDQRIRESLANRLSERGHSVESVAKAMDGVERAVSGGFDAVVLDLGLPDLDGVDALQMIRAVSEIPVIVATARDDEGEIVRIFDAGADDYVVKPFSADHLEARLRAVLRRAGPDQSGRRVMVGELSLDLDAHEAALAGRPLDLTYMEYELLKFLASHPGKVFNRETLLSRVWGYDYFGGARTVDVHVRRLRSKLGEEHAGLIQTVRSVGYSFGQSRWAV